MLHFLLTPALGTHIGQHRQNNDDVVNYKYPTALPQLDTYGALFLLADGVGGRAGGEQAGRMALDLLIDTFYHGKPKVLENHLNQAIQTVNQRVYEVMKPAATTLLAALFHENKLTVASVGDSAAFWCDSSGIRKLTHEHVYIPDPLAPEKRRLERAIGHRAEVHADFINLEVAPGGRLLLCSDGVTAYFGEQELYPLVFSGTPADAASILIRQANAAGGADNISVVIVEVGQPFSTIEELQNHVYRLSPYITNIPAPNHESHIDTSPHTERAPSPPKKSNNWGIILGVLLLVLAMVAAAALMAALVGDSITATATPTASATATASLTATATATATASLTATTTATATASPTASATATATASATATATASPTATATATASATPSATRTASATAPFLHAGVQVTFQESAVLYRAVNSETVAFVLRRGQPYLMLEILEAEQTWYHLRDIETEQNGWISAENLPPYTFIP